MNILLVPVGSSGDVHPFIGMGLLLKKRGHHVTVIVNGHFQTLVRKAGLDFEELGTAEQYQAAADNPKLWHPLWSLPLILKMTAPTIGPLLEVIKRRTVPGQTVVVGSSLAFGARIAEDAWKIPTAIVHLQPGVLRSVFAPPKFPTMSIPASLPATVIKFLYRLVDFVVDPLIAGPINQTRAELGLPPVKRIMGDYWHSPRLTLGLWPDWYAPPQKDWPASLRLTGFPLYDGAGLENTSPGLKEFLEEGSPPLVFTGGSAMRRGQKFFFESAKAAQILGCRAALITQFPDQLPKNLPPGVRHFSYLPFSQIFPHAAVIVHHGGIGTTSQALKSGRPQLIVPFSNDQPDNAARVKKLGAGDFLSPSAYRANKVAARLEGLMADTSLQQRCRNIVSQLDPSALERTCDLIEQLRTA